MDDDDTMDGDDKMDVALLKMERCFNFALLQDNGAAYEAGGLEVGQLILEVDGHKVEGNFSKLLIVAVNEEEK